MSCLSPISVPSRAKDARPGQYMQVGCGKCIGCLKDRQNAWIYRLEADMRTYKHSYFVTLTYEDEFLPLLIGDKYDENNVLKTFEYLKRKEFRNFVPTLFPKDLSNYIKRVRKACDPIKFKYFACGEYGSNGNRPHYHMAVYSNGNPVVLERCINDAWNFGYIYIEPLIPNRVAYVTKYMLKDNPENKVYDAQLAPFLRASRGLGIDGFLRDEKTLAYYGNDTFVGWPLSNGTRIALPRYFRKVFYSSEPFTSDQIQEQNDNRFKKEQKRFNDFAISYRIEHSNCTDEEIHHAYFNKYDIEETQRIHKLRQQRKKDF